MHNVLSKTLIFAVFWPEMRNFSDRCRFYGVVKNQSVGKNTYIMTK